VIRPADIADKARVITLLQHSRQAAGFDHADGMTGFAFAFDTAYAERLFLTHLLRPEMLCLLLDQDDAAQGVLMAVAAEHPFGPVRLARETVWWIEPDYRGLSALRMLEAYEDWARSQDCAYSGMAGMGEDPDVSRLYRRRGYRPAEIHFLKAI
jgi:GNAT superfamily N-acetyltransferase